jgi:ATP/ADP translocase
MLLKDRRQAAGLDFIIVSVVALVGCLTSAAMHSSGWTVGMGVVALVAVVSGVSWVFAGRRRAIGGGDQRGRR